MGDMFLILAPSRGFLHPDFNYPVKWGRSGKVLTFLPEVGSQQNEVIRSQAER